MNFDKIKEKYAKKTKAIVMGNGPSLNQYDWELIRKNNKDAIFLSCNRISNIFYKNKSTWRPDMYCCFTSTSLTNPDWKKSIDQCLSQEEIDSFVFDNYRNVSDIKDFHSNVYFCTQVGEHDRHKEIPQDFIDIPIDEYFIKSYSATVPLFQICNWLKIESIFLIGQDGYTKKLGLNHYSESYGFEPNNFKKSNDRIKKLHNELSRFFKLRGVKVFNASRDSVLEGFYEYKDLSSL